MQLFSKEIKKGNISPKVRIYFVSSLRSCQISANRLSANITTQYQQKNRLLRQIRGKNKINFAPH